MDSHRAGQGHKVGSQGRAIRQGHRTGPQEWLQGRATGHGHRAGSQGMT